MTLCLKNLNTDQVIAGLAPFGIKPRLARLVQAAAIRTNALPLEGPEVSARALEKIRPEVDIPNLILRKKQVSAQDLFAKYLFECRGGDCVEAVRIPLLHKADDKKYIVCVSSQVGCPLGCVFCRTGRMGFKRNLEPWEMVDQVCKIQADSDYPVRGVVFMGMGEPLLNYDAVMQAARIMAEPCGLAINRKSITISTAGIVPGIRRFTQERRPYRLMISLSFADPARRREFMPVEATYPTPDLIAAVRAYQAATRQKVTLAWVMMSGINVGEQDTLQLAAWVKDLPMILDLIDVNDPDGRYQPPTRDELNHFLDALRKNVGVPIVRRYSGGQDICAACGLLAGGA